MRCVLSFVFMSSSSAFHNFPKLIPNGQHVTVCGIPWPAVGHLKPLPHQDDLFYAFQGFPRNHFGEDFYEFAEKIAPITAHLHLGDAVGINGEGLQIGEGDINFSRLALILNELCPQASFIPEIWQGHKNGGKGFWIALERLEPLF